MRIRRVRIVLSSTTENSIYLMHDVCFTHFTARAEFKDREFTQDFVFDWTMVDGEGGSK